MSVVFINCYYSAAETLTVNNPGLYSDVMDLPVVENRQRVVANEEVGVPHHEQAVAEILVLQNALLGLLKALSPLSGYLGCGVKTNVSFAVTMEPLLGDVLLLRPDAKARQ